MKFKISKGNVFRLIMIIVAIAIVIYTISTFTPEFYAVLKSGNLEEMETFIEQNGKEGIWVLVLLQVIQTITIFFPGVPIYMCSGIVYGKLLGTIICYLTYVASNMGVYLVVRELRRRTNAIIQDGSTSRVEMIASKTKYPDLFIMLLCVIPVIPNGMIPYVAVRAGISAGKFFRAVAVGCIPGIFLFVCFGDLLFSEYFIILIVAVLAFAVIAVLTGLLIRPKIMAFIEKHFGEN
ncbi:MAG: VTT domain-containing protein [Butyrivibrio sp.]|nr:VTT domain-containing protein [Butyrivibrio sp.]